MYEKNNQEKTSAITEISTKQLCEYSDKQIMRLSGRPQPFLEYSPESLDKLILSISDHGIIEPIKVIFYLNKARAEIGSGELSKLSGLTGYAEFRSGQLISNFAHDPGDWNKVAEATGYGKYIDLSEIGGTQQGYYDIGAREALAMAGIVGSTDRIAETLAQIIIDSARHWSYVGSDEMKYIGVGVSCNSDMWYAAIMVTNTTDYEN